MSGMGPGMMGPMGGMMGGWSGPWWGWLMMLLFWGVLVAVPIALVRLLWPPAGRGGAGTGAGPGSSRDEALETLRQRYARGEIGREEFLRIRDDLRDRRE